MTDYYPYFKKNTFFKYLYYFTKERGVALSGNAGCAFKPRVPRYSSFHNRVTCLRERPTSVRCDCLHMKVSPCSLLARIFARPVPVFPIPAGTYLGLLSASPTHQPTSLLPLVCVAQKFKLFGMMSSFPLFSLNFVMFRRLDATIRF